MALRERAKLGTGITSHIGPCAQGIFILFRTVHHHSADRILFWSFWDQFGHLASLRIEFRCSFGMGPWVVFQYYTATHKETHINRDCHFRFFVVLLDSFFCCLT